MAEPGRPRNHAPYAAIPAERSTELDVGGAERPAVELPAPPTESTAVTGPVSEVNHGSVRSPWLVQHQFKKGFDERRTGGSQIVEYNAPKATVRRAARVAFFDRIQILCDIADGKPLPWEKRIRYRKTRGPNKDELQGKPSQQYIRGSGDSDNVTLNDTLVITKGEESASVADRLAAIEMLGKMGAVHIPIEEAEDIDRNAPPPVYVLLIE